MKKRAQLNRKRDRFTRLIAGLFVGGIFLFQGTGFITSEARAADPVARNRDVTSFIGTTNLSDSAYNYGLYGTPLSQTVNIYNGVNAVIGTLTSGSTSLNPASAVSMTVSSTGAYRIGLDSSNANTYGYLYVTGPFDTTNASTLTAASGSSIEVGSLGSLVIGYAESGQKGLGTVSFNSGAQLVNNGSDTSGMGGVSVMNGSLLQFGDASDSSALTGYYSGAGSLRNFGTVNVYNKTDGSDSFDVSNYIDSDSTYGSGTLVVTGSAVLGSSNTSLSGVIRVGGDLGISSASSNASFATSSTIDVNGLLSVYNDNETSGSNLNVNSTETTVGGLWVKRLSDSSNNATGGTLTIGQSSDTTAISVLNVNGLDEKFNTDGTRSTSGLYDLYLGRNAINYGTINLDDAEGSGIIFSGASSTGSDEIVGLHNSSIAKIAADGDLSLYGIDENVSVTGHGPLTIDNDGTITVAGDLGIDSASDISLENSGTITASSLTVGNKLTVANATAGKIDTGEVNLNGGALSNTGEYTFKEMNLTSGSISGTYTGTVTTADSVVTQPKVNVTGYVTLDGDTEFAHETGDDPLNVTISENGGFNGSGHVLTFTDAAVKNASSLGSAALTADTIYFNGDSDYNYTGTGANLLNGNVNFDGNASLTVDANNPLYLAAGKSLTMGGNDDFATLVFDIDEASDTPLITLTSADGTSAAAEVHANIQLEDSYKSYKPGRREVTLIKTANAGSVYDVNSISLSGTNSNNTLFTTREGHVSGDLTSYVLDITNRGFSDFAETINQRNAAVYIDTLLQSPEGISGELGDFITDVMDLDSNTDPHVVGRLLDALSGANRANALMLAMSDPWQYSFNQMGYQTHRAYTPDCQTCGTVWRGQMEYYGGEYYGDGMVYDDGYGYNMGSVFGNYGSAPNSAWAAAHTTSMNARDDDNCDKYGITNTGLSVGYDVMNYANAVAGIVFDYSQPFLYSSWDDVSQHIDQSNFNLGLYGTKTNYNGLSLTGYVGFGLQHMNSKRDVRMAGIDPSLAIADTLAAGNWYRSANNGHSFAAAVKIARDMNFYNWCVFRPLVQFDTQSVWLDESEEYGNAIALNYDKNNWNRTFVRAGFETEKNTQFCRFTSRFLYAYQLNDKSTPEMTASLAGDYTGNSMTIYGIDLGREYFDAGFGAVGYLDCAYRWAISGNYDFTTSEQSTAHTGTVAMSYFF